MSSFNTETNAKWILAGEHAVLRGHSALVFPLKSKQLSLSYNDNANKLTASFKGQHANDIHMLFWSLIEHGVNLSGHSLRELSGLFTLHNAIPIGRGLGASAALSVAVARWFQWKSFISETELFSFACKLENLFHGKSSGLDIAASQSETGLLFQQSKWQTITQQWSPKLFLSFSGRIGVTAHCVKKVLRFMKQSPEAAKAIDEQMNQAVLTAKEALMLGEAKGLPSLSHAIDSANECFKAWGLNDKLCTSHIEQLKEAGALAAKPTGSGDGGYVLSLWKAPPPKECEQYLIPCF